MTPVELQIYVRAYEVRRDEQQRTTQINLYNLAALTRPMIWAKHPPSYEKAFPDGEGKKSDTMTDEQMYAMARALNALFGGEEVD